MVNCLAIRNGHGHREWELHSCLVFASVGPLREVCLEEMKVNPTIPVVLLLDSGGGGQLHITPEASLVAEHFSIRLFFFRKNMTPNKEAEKRWHQILARGTHELSALGLYCAREATSSNTQHVLLVLFRGLA